MTTEENDQFKLLPHHEQQDLCTTRLPYRQGRKLTAVKVYTINNESKHLLIFNVPSLNLRQETKGLFMKFGKLLQFNVTKYPSEQFTETYHAVFENIQSARIAKKMLDTKNYYGSNLHICYAPELETVEETKEKMLLRRTQVIGRLKNLQKEAVLSKMLLDNKIEEKLKMNLSNEIKNEVIDNEIKHKTKMDMSVENKIVYGKRKIKDVKKKSVKKSKNADSNLKIQNNLNSYVVAENVILNPVSINTDAGNIATNLTESNISDVPGPSFQSSSTIDIIDFTQPETEVISNINEALNYNSFGKEVIKQIPSKPVNRIKFNINKKS